MLLGVSIDLRFTIRMYIPWCQVIITVLSPDDPSRKHNLDCACVNFESLSVRAIFFAIFEIFFNKCMFMNKNLSLRLNTYNRNTVFYRLNRSCSDVTIKIGRTPQQQSSDWLAFTKDIFIKKMDHFIKKKKKKCGSSLLSSILQVVRPSCYWH